jgi:hypothetical protein
MALGRIVINIGGDYMVFDYILHLTEPVDRYPGKKFAFSRDAVGKDYIKGRNSVRCYQEKTVSEIIDVPDLAASDEFDVRHICLQDDFFHLFLLAIGRNSGYFD